jgi:thiol-disulfide isomerase/thioredoxin
MEGAIPVGDDLPDLALDDLEGEPVALASFRGKDTVFLFWNPGCGFCRAMHEDLLEWEGRRNGAPPRLVVISSGDREEITAEGFRSTVLVDAGSDGSSAFGAGGTPMAVLADADGRVRSRVVAGAPSVLALLSNGRRTGVATEDHPAAV